ncbi:MAG: hypothetical protein ACPGRW_09510 [Flavobacteriaceae bacterium]
MLNRGMYFIVALSLATIGLLFFQASCVEETSGETIIRTDLSTYENFQSTYRAYSVHLPVDWKIKEHRKSASLQALSPFSRSSDNQYREHVSIFPMRGTVTHNRKKGMEKESLNLNSFAARHHKQLSRTLTNFKSIQTGEQVLNGIKAKRYVYAYEDAQDAGKVLKSLVYILVYNNEAYLINGTDLAEEFNDSSKLFEEVAESIQFNLETASL